MSMFGNKEKVAKAAQEIADTLLITEHIKELKDAQKVLQDDIASLDKRLASIEATIEKIGVEVKFEAMKEVQAGLTQMQSAVFEKFSQMAVDIDRIKQSRQVLPNGHNEIEAPTVPNISGD